VTAGFKAPPLWLVNYRVIYKAKAIAPQIYKGCEASKKLVFYQFTSNSIKETKINVLQNSPNQSEIIQPTL